MDEAGALFKETPAALKKMSRKDLVRCYRQRVQKLHPDKGGDPGRFIKLTRAYHELLRSKP
jgi:DnaJ-class molecular chaperone